MKGILQLIGLIFIAGIIYGVYISISAVTTGGKDIERLEKEAERNCPARQSADKLSLAFEGLDLEWEQVFGTYEFRAPLTDELYTPDSTNDELLIWHGSFQNQSTLTIE